MQIQSISAHSATSPLNLQAHVRQAAAASTGTPAAISAERTSISQAARELLAADGNAAAPAAKGASAVYDTSHGPLLLDIDTYFTPATAADTSFTLPPLLLPSPGNITALTSHITEKLPQFLARHDIPSPPASISYDPEGKIQLPADYPHAAAFEAALASEPALDRQLRTVNALGSVLVETRKSLPFQQEYAAAPASATGAVIAKYGHLFSNNRSDDSIALNFRADGEASLTANGRAVF